MKNNHLQMILFHFYCALFCMIFFGCRASLQAPKLNIAEQKVVKTARIPRMTIGLELPVENLTGEEETETSQLDESMTPITADSDAIAYVKAMIKALRDTDLFKEVDFVNRLSSTPDLIFETKTVKFEPREPSKRWITYLTLGLFPTWDRFSHATTCKLKSPKSESYYFMEYEHESVEMFGFLPMLFKLSNAWSVDYSMERYYDQFILNMLSKTDEINELVQDK